MRLPRPTQGRRSSSDEDRDRTADAARRTATTTAIAGARVVFTATRDRDGRRVAPTPRGDVNDPATAMSLRRPPPRARLARATLRGAIRAFGSSVWPCPASRGRPSRSRTRCRGVATSPSTSSCHRSEKLIAANTSLSAGTGPCQLAGPSRSVRTGLPVTSCPFAASAPGLSAAARGEPRFVDIHVHGVVDLFDALHVELAVERTQQGGWRGTAIFRSLPDRRRSPRG